MSDDAKAPEAATAEDAQKAAPAAKPAAKEPPIVVLIAVVVLALGAGAALGTLLLAPRIIHARQAAALAEAKDPHHKKEKKDKKKEKKGGKEGEGKSPVYKLDNLIVNPAGSLGQRFLMCSVAIESDDPKALDVLRENEIELRDKVVSSLASRTLDELTAPGARDTIRTRLLGVIRPVLGEDGQDAEIKVYLPQYVIQ